MYNIKWLLTCLAIPPAWISMLAHILISFKPDKLFDENKRVIFIKFYEIKMNKRRER